MTVTATCKRRRRQAVRRQLGQKRGGNRKPHLISRKTK